MEPERWCQFCSRQALLKILDLQVQNILLINNNYMLS
jgi:hypothetical protein